MFGNEAKKSPCHILSIDEKSHLEISNSLSEIGSGILFFVELSVF